MPTKSAIFEKVGSTFSTFFLYIWVLTRFPGIKVMLLYSTLAGSIFKRGFSMVTRGHAGYQVAIYLLCVFPTDILDASHNLKTHRLMVIGPSSIAYAVENPVHWTVSSCNAGYAFNDLV